MITDHIQALKKDNDPIAQFSAVQSLLGITQQHENDDNDEREDVNISIDDPRYRWLASPARGATIDSLFKQDQFYGSEVERSEVAASSSSSLDSLVFGAIPPRSLSVVFERLCSRGAFANITGKKKAAFYDIGSGDGIACVTAAMLMPFTKVAGYEILPSLVELSQEKAIQYNELASGLGDDVVSSIDFQLEDCRLADWSDGRVVLANAPCFDHALMDTLGERADCLEPGSIFVVVGRTLSSENMELVDRVCLPANGLGMYGEPSMDDEEDEEDEKDEDEDDDEDGVASRAGLFTFNVYQRILNNDDQNESSSSSCDIFLPSITDNSIQETLREKGAFRNIMEIVSNEKHADKTRATATFLLRSSMTSHPSSRVMLDLNILDMIFTLLKKESSLMLRVCGVLLLSELSTTRRGQHAIMQHDEARSALHLVIDEEHSPAAVVAAGIEIFHNLSSGRLGCTFLNVEYQKVRSDLLKLDDAGSGRAKSVIEKLDRMW